MGPLVENSEPGTSSDYLTPPEGEAEAETSGADADMEEAVEDLLQDELNSPVEETEGYSVDPWPWHITCPNQNDSKSSQELMRHNHLTTLAEWES